ncbi:MAG TPA: type II toxin-antitoxin system HicB family antitoxin [Chloroflexota bacterium]|nr:type II toxin-antitoxin system HicB family antitoxin [Chloroflexota bacterium]
MMLEYQGYRAEVEVDLDANILFGRVIDLRTVITFQAERVDQVREAFQEAIDDYLLYCRERGKEPERPFSGRISFRTTPEIHRLIAEASASEGLSANAWMEKVLVAAVHDALHRTEQRNVISMDYTLTGPVPGQTGTIPPLYAQELLSGGLAKIS